MEQTAVEYVIQNVIKKHFGGGWLIDETIKKEIEQANEMFKQQIIDAYQTSHISTMTAEQYYNEKYNK